MPAQGVGFAPLLLSLSFAVMGAFWAGPTGAQDRGLYVGAKRGTTDVDASLGDTLRQTLDGDEDTSALLVGYRVGRFWAIEAALHDLGSFRGSGPPCRDGAPICPAVLVPTEADAEAYSLSILPQLPLGNRITIYGKIGIATWEAEIRDASVEERPLIDEFSEEGLLYGLGARMKLFFGLRLFAEWENIDDDLETTSFGLVFQF